MLSFFRCGTALLLALSLAGAAELTPEQRRRNVESFDVIWNKIRERHWDPKLGGVDWDQARSDLRPKVENAKSMDEARAAMRELLGRLHQSHFNVIPADVYSEVGSAAMGEGTPRIDVRVIGDQAVVSSVEPASAAEKEGVRTGWIVARAGKQDVTAMLQRALKAQAASSTRGLILRRAVLALLSGDIGSQLEVTFKDGDDRPQVRKLTLEAPRGTLTRFGNLPPTHIWVDARVLDRGSSKIGYLAFNYFLDPVHVMGAANDMLASCLKRCDAVVIDLRGNGGGIGGMSMGLAGWFVPEANQVLGTMILRDNQLKFAISPRAQTFDGPLAILVDSGSASTSEIFAGGLKDLGRAHIFGERTAAAALPSFLEKLPNGDGFQYAVANYISTGGQPLEGIGVIPDVEAPWNRGDLLAGRDPAMEAALEWIRARKKAAVQ